MDKNISSAQLPRGARLVKREPFDGKSLELAKDLARRGASESLVRAMGGDEAVRLYLHAKKSN